MSMDALAGLMQGQRYLPGGAVDPSRAAVLAVPELVEGLPATFPGADGPRIPCACAAALGPLVDAVVRGAAAAAGSPNATLTGKALVHDPLVDALVRLAREGERVSPGAATVPFLATLSASAESTSRVALDGAERAAALQRIGAAVLGRMGAAVLRLQESGVTVPALAVAACRARAAALFPRDEDPSIPVLCGLVGTPIPADVADAALKAAGRAVVGLVERHAANKSTAEDAPLVVSHLTPDRLDQPADNLVEDLRHDPDVLGVVLPALARFADAASLQAAGVPTDLATRLLDPRTGLAVGATLVDAVRELQRWDVFSALTGALTDPPEGTRATATPRGGVGPATVVAVGLGRLRAQAAREGDDALATLGRAWVEATRAARGASADLGHAGLVVFDDAVDALRFALSLPQRLRRPVPVGLGHGVVLGGVDGVHAWLAGPAVDAALRWLAGGPRPSRAVDPLGAHALAHSGGWLCGDGLGIDTAAAEAVHETRLRRGLATAVDGPPAGDPRVPRSIDLYRVFELDGDVIALVHVPGVAGGFEGLRLSREAWRALLDRDAGLAEGARPASSASSSLPPAPAPVLADPGASWETPEDTSEAAPVMLDLAEGPRPRISFDAVAAAFQPVEDEETQEEARGRTDDDVVDYYLPPADRAPTPAAPAAPAAPVARARPAFELEVEDEDEDEDAGDSFADPFAAPPAPPAEKPRAVDPFAAGPALFVEDDRPIAPADPFAVVDPFADAPVAAPSADPFAAPRKPAVDPFAVDDPFGTAVGAPAAADDDDPFAWAPPTESATPAAGADAFSLADPVPQAAAAPEKLAEKPAARKSGKAGKPRAGHMDFDFLLKGYAFFQEGDAAVFGRPYGQRMVDRHSYPFRGDADEAYQSFLRDKISEGFVPRAELMGEIPADARPQPLDVDRLNRAWERLS